MPNSRSQSKAGAKRSLDFDHDNNTSAASNNSEIIDVDLSSPAAAVTPSKKKKSNKRNLNDYFGSPAKDSATTTAVTPSKAAATSTAAVVTPPDTKRSKQESPVAETQHQEQQPGEDNEYIPTYLNKNIEYHRRGETSLDPVTEKVFQLVAKHYVIPDGFEHARSFGPKSGVAFEQRVVTAYVNHQLKPKLLDMGSSSEKKATVICTCCAEIGHQRDDCPHLL